MITRYLAVCLLLFAAGADGIAQDADVLIKNGRVLDGTGNPDFRADVAIAGDRIIAVGKLDRMSAARTIDAAGRFVAPGFIDIHSHADRTLVGDDREARAAHNLVAQGITTIAGGPDGRNPIWPIADEIAAYQRLGIGINFVPMVGHGTVRGEVMGDVYERPATAVEIERMQALVRQGMEQGAWGLGAGPEYRPGRFSTTEELIALAHVVAEYDGFYFAHQRSQSPLPLWQLPRHDPWAQRARRRLASHRHRRHEGNHPHRSRDRHPRRRQPHQSQRTLELGSLGGRHSAHRSSSRARRAGVSRPIPIRNVRWRRHRRDPCLGVRATGNGSLRRPGRAALARAGDLRRLQEQLGNATWQTQSSARCSSRTSSTCSTCRVVPIGTSSFRSPRTRRSWVRRYRRSRGRTARPSWTHSSTSR